MRKLSAGRRRRDADELNSLVSKCIKGIPADIRELLNHRQLAQICYTRTGKRVSPMRSESIKAALNSLKRV